MILLQIEIIFHGKILVITQKPLLILNAKKMEVHLLQRTITKWFISVVKSFVNNPQEHFSH